MTWQPIATAPTGGGAESTTDPAWVEPPQLLVRVTDGRCHVVYWDSYYAALGGGFDGVEWHGWREYLSGDCPETEPTHWMPLPEPPQEDR